jgi:sigma-B regulation protein RsbU (phosphoserine phosphatase)
MSDYREIINSFKAKRLTDADIEQRLSDLMLLIDFSSSLNQASEINEIADLLLLTLMGSMKSRRSAFLLPVKDGFAVTHAKGMKLPEKPVNLGLSPTYADYYIVDETGVTPWKELREKYGLYLIFPLKRQDKLLALVAMGGKIGAKGYTNQEIEMAVSLVQMCAGALENAQNHHALQRLNKQLTLKIYQLNSLFELSKDFNAVWDSETIFRILGSSLIGQLLISRCAVFTFTGGKLDLKFMRGLRLTSSDLECLTCLADPSFFPDEKDPAFSLDLQSGPVQLLCNTQKIHLILPMILNDEIRGIILLGEKKNRKQFTQEDFDFMTTLGNLALVADENARMQQEMIEKQRMEKELAIAREIQVGLLPQSTPKIRGYEIASAFYPCYTVGGDYFDFLPLSEDEIAIAIGDVSGKSTPAALLMACLQASLRTLTAMRVKEPEITIRRINHLLCESQSQSSKYVTFFYGILNHQTGTMTYVNAGHPYPLVVKKGGELVRLETGGTVMGFFQDANYRKGVYQVDPGDLMMFYTDGVSELTNDQEEEFGVERIAATLRQHQNEPVNAIQEALMQALGTHREAQSQGDDITFILLKRD